MISGFSPTCWRARPPPQPPSRPCCKTRSSPQGCCPAAGRWWHATVSWQPAPTGVFGGGGGVRGRCEGSKRAGAGQWSGKRGARRSCGGRGGEGRGGKGEGTTPVPHPPPGTSGAFPVTSIPTLSTLSTHACRCGVVEIGCSLQAPSDDPSHGGNPGQEARLRSELLRLSEDLVLMLTAQV